LSIAFAGNDVKVEVVVQGSTHASASSHENMFFALDSALKDVQAKF
jgi:hypothetical protein